MAQQSRIVHIINQEVALEYDLTPTQAVLIAYMISAWNWAEYIEFSEGGGGYWIAHAKILSDLPSFIRTKVNSKRQAKELSEKGVLRKFILNGGCQRSVYDIVDDFMEAWNYNPKVVAYNSMRDYDDELYHSFLENNNVVYFRVNQSFSIKHKLSPTATIVLSYLMNLPNWASGHRLGGYCLTYKKMLSDLPLFLKTERNARSILGDLESKQIIKRNFSYRGQELFGVDLSASFKEYSSIFGDISEPMKDRLTRKE